MRQKIPKLANKYHFSMARHLAALNFLNTVKYVLIAIDRFQNASDGKKLYRSAADHVEDAEY